MKGIKHLVGFTTFKRNFREIFKFTKEKKKQRDCVWILMKFISSCYNKVGNVVLLLSSHK